MFGWEYPPHHSGGLGVACFGLTRALADEGVGVVMVLPRKAPLLGKHTRAKFAGLDALHLRAGQEAPSCYASPAVFENAYGRNLKGQVLAYARAAETIAREESYDLIHAHDWLTALAGIAAKRISGKPLIFHVHATEFDRSGGEGANPEVYAIERKGMEASDLVVAVSEYTKHILVEKYGIAPDKVAVLHNGMDADYFDVLSSGETQHADRGHAAELGRFVERLHARGGKLVLFAGRITLQKGPDYFVELAREIRKRRPNTFFLVAGTGDMEEQMIREVAGAGISDACYFFGRYQGAETEALFKAADLYVFPSVSEPFGIIPLEAASCGAPVLMSKQSGVSEVFKNALLVDFWDIDEMVNKSIALLDNPALAQTLQVESKKELPGITWKHAAKKLLTHYQALAI